MNQTGRRSSSRQERRSQSQLECYLPFKLFDGRDSAMSMFEGGAPESILQMQTKDAMGASEIAQMDHFISDTAQTMVAPHCLTCAPHEEGLKADLFKMETLGDLMKRHKDAFQEEYTEFGPASVWAPDPPNANSLPIPVAARQLGKFFDLRGELSTIAHVRRARCRQRPKPPPLLLGRAVTPLNNNMALQRSATSLGLTSEKKSSAYKEAVLKKNAAQRKSENSAYEPPTSARKQFPSSLQGLYLPPARNDISIAEDLRYNAGKELKEGGRKAKMAAGAIAGFAI